MVNPTRRKLAQNTNTLLSGVFDVWREVVKIERGRDYRRQAFLPEKLDAVVDYYEDREVYTIPWFDNFVADVNDYITGADVE